MKFNLLHSSLLLSLAFAVPGCADAQTLPPISGFDKKPLFDYGSWQKKYSASKGELTLQSSDGKGGLGDNVELDLSGYASFSPVLKLTPGANHKAKRVKLVLRDAKGASSTWVYSLDPLPAAQSATLIPQDGAPLSAPNQVDAKTGAADLSQIRQWQLQGDWSGDAFDVAFDEALLSSPTAEIIAAREAAQTRLAQAAEKKRLEQIELRKKYTRNQNSPAVVSMAPVAGDVLAIEIQAGRVVPSELKLYVPQEGDKKREIKRKADGETNVVVLSRGGHEVGWLIGPNRETLVTHEKLQGDPLLTFVADDKAQYSVTSPDDANFAAAVPPVAVYRKSKPNDWAQGPGDQAVRHTLFLQMPQPLQSGKKYVVSFGELNVKDASAQFVNEPNQVRSEAVHVNQIGYRPTDPAKRAFVSMWLGTGGALKLPDSLNFSIVEDKSGKEVWKGQSSDIWRVGKMEEMAREANFSGTDVARLDFSDFQTPGKYRITVEGIGTSYPFEIAEDVWKKAFLVQMKGLYNQRSGMALGPPYTNFNKPRDMHPADGFPVYKTSVRWVEKGGENWDAIRAGSTGERVDYAWGGYHDAGDWNPRRVAHLQVTMAQLEVMRMFPDYFSKLDLNIPATKGVPDVLTEAMWEFDTFRRLQEPNGGVGYGIESGLGDPAEGEVSWMNSFPSYVFAPDYFNSWVYAAVGARLAGLLEPYDPKKAADYRASAMRAFEFAEADFARDKAKGETDKRNNTWEALDHRNLAALELYRLTKDKKYHDFFLEDTVLTDEKPDLFVWTKHVQREHAFIYATLPTGLGDEKLKSRAVVATEDMAKRALEYAVNNAWNLTTPDKGKPQFLGFYSTPDALDLTRAHFLTGKPEYLAGAVQATQFQSGANPSNLVYTSGLGANPVKHSFKLDSRRTGQSAPVGLTPYGNIDLVKWNQEWITWPITWFVGKDTQPDAYAWPVNEAYWDVGGWPSFNEFTVDRWAPNIQVWGYLAARK